MLAIATSIDAFFVGISRTFLKMPIIEPALILGCVMFILVCCGAIIVHMELMEHWELISLKNHRK